MKIKSFLLHGIPKSVLFKIIIALLIMLIGRNVFAQDFNVTSSITSPIGGGRTGTYTGTEIYNTGSTTYYYVNTRYNGRLSRIIYNLPLPSSWPDGDCFSSGDLIYTVTMNMATDDWRNRFSTPFVSGSSSGTNWSTSNVIYVSMRKIYFTFKIPIDDNNCYDFIYIDLKSTSLSNNAFTGDTNWNLSNITLSVDFPTSSGGGSGSGSSTNNSQEIINNNNENTQDIIENNNENTQQIKDTIQDNLNTCRDSYNLFNINGEVNIKGNDGTTIGSNNTVSGNILTSNYNSALSHGYGQKFTNLNGKIFTVSGKGVSNGTGTGAKISIYDNNVLKRELDLTPDNYGVATYTGTSNNIVIAFSTKGGTGAQFTDIQVNLGGSALSYEPFGEVCTNKIDSVNNSINDINNSLIDDDAPTIDLSGINTPSNSPVSDLLTMPLTILNAVFDITDDTCSPYVIPFDFSGGNDTLSFPCIDLEDLLGTTFYNILDTILCFYMSYQIAMMCISIYEDITSLRDGFDSLYSPKHAQPLGKHTSEVGL